MGLENKVNDMIPYLLCADIVTHFSFVYAKVQSSPINLMSHINRFNIVHLVLTIF